MSVSVLVILGSARDEGDTAALVDAVLAGREATRIDLIDLSIRHYEYDRPPDGDDFLTVVDAMHRHDVIVFATPVYWYAMSGRMKVLFDRLTDLITVRKDLGRALRGRATALIACANSPELPEGFEVPFRDTSTYLGMDYKGAFYAERSQIRTMADDILDRAEAFGDRLFVSGQAENEPLS